MLNSALINTQIGINREVPRLWIEGETLAKCGIKIGSTLYVKFNKSKSTVHLSEKSNNPDHQIKVSKRTNNKRTKPLIELRHIQLDELFGVGQKVRIIIKSGKITIRLHHHTEKVKERLQRFQEKLKSNTPLETGSICHGAGFLDSSFHSGLMKSNIPSFVKVVNEIDSKYLNVSIANNPQLFTDETIFINSPVQDMKLGNDFYLDIVISGLPCLGASSSGRSSKKLKFAEQHETAGSIFYYFLNFIQSTNPALIVLENVAPYEKTASFTVIKDVLSHLGYNLSYSTLNGNDFGSLESRERLFLVATTEGLPVFDFDLVESIKEKEDMAGDILERVPLDSGRWRTYDYLDKAEIKAKQKGNGFKRSFILPTDTTTNVIKKTNHKCQTDGVFVRHPTNESLSRLPSAIEHAKLKTVPYEKIKDLSETLACEVLGQGIIYSLVEALGISLGKQLKH